MKFTKTMRVWVLAIVTVLFALGLSVGCSSYVPVKEGTCSPGRVWVPPTQKASGAWKAGYCSEAR